MIEQIRDLALLIVDDSKSQRDYAQRLCQDLGIDCVYQAADGIEALAVLQQHAIDVALIDLEMPIMDGVDLIRSIAQKNWVDSVVILSAKDPVLIASVGTMAEADGLHVLGTFHKPLQADLLQCSLLRFVKNRSAPGSAEQPIHAAEVTAVELSNAIVKGELTLAYQPKLTVQRLLLRGVEALARWHHPTKGNISPAVFIPLAERHGMINLLTRMLLKQALMQKQQWQQRGFTFQIAFNLSPISLADLSIVDWLVDVARQYRVAPGDITLEVTENAISEELANAIQTLARLRLKGFHIAIDDYGTGFANAQQLSRVPATELKIDRALVDKVSARSQQHAILANTVALAKSLNLTIVAEGVETAEDFAIIRELGIEQVQGFYFSKPLSASGLLDWIKQDLGQLRNCL